MMVSETARHLLMTAAVAVCFSAALLAEGGTTHTDVQNKDGDPSPTAGESDINTYTYQDEQINIDGGKDGILRVLRVDQKNLINDYVVAVFPINNAAPIEIRAVFRNITALEGGQAEVIRDKVQKQDFLIVWAPPFQIPHIKAALCELDVPWLKDEMDGSKEAYYKAKFRDIVTIDGMANVMAGGSDYRSVLDTVNNAALRTGEPYRTESYLKYSKLIDQPIPQILLEAAVYEVEVSNEMRLGVDYIAWKNGPGRNLFEFISWGSDDTPIFPGQSRHGSYLMGNALLTAAYVDFLQGVGRARLVTKGKILVKNSSSGSLEAVDEVIHFRVHPDDDTTPISGIEADFSQNGDNDPDILIHNRSLDKDTALDIGFVLEVSPMIAQQTTELKIDLAVSDIVGQTPSGAPQVRSTSLSTTVLVRDGVPFCVTGLRRSEDVKNTAKVPLLGDIPILGYLFGHEANVKRQTEMVVLITPKIRFGTEADLEMANEEDDLIRAQVAERVELSVPATRYGFDQWLIGSDP